MIRLVLSDLTRGLEVNKITGPILEIFIDPATPLTTHFERAQYHLLSGFKWYLNELYGSENAPLRSLEARNEAEAVITSTLNTLSVTENLQSP